MKKTHRITMKSGLALLLTLSVFPVPSHLRAEEASQDAARMQAYYEIVNNVLNPSSYESPQIVTDPDALYNGGEGLAYADLIDFDQDGQDELYMLYAQPSSTDPYNSDHVQEVWTYRNGDVVQLFADSNYGFGMDGERSTELITGKDQVYLNFYSELERGGYNRLLTLTDGSFEEQAVLEYWENGSDENGAFTYAYLITENGTQREVTQQEYEDALSTYLSGEALQLVNSGAGSPYFSVPVESNSTEIPAFLQKLKQEARPSLAKQKLEPSQAEQTKLNQFLSSFAGLRGSSAYAEDGEDVSFNAEDYDSGTVQNWMSWALLLEEKFDKVKEFPQRAQGIESLETEGFVYEPYNTQALNRFTKNTMGIRITDTKQHNDGMGEYNDNGIPPFQQKAENTYILYPDAGYMGLAETQVEALYTLGGGYYYADLNTYTSDEATIDVSTLAPSDSGYALLKRVAIGGKPQWQLVRYGEQGSMLSEAELQTYLFKATNK